MTDSLNTCIVGVDGGGTSCRIALVCNGVRHEVRLGSANVTTNREAAVERILQGLGEVAKQAGMPESQFADCHAYLGLAGVMNDDDAAYVSYALPFRHVAVSDDRRTNMVGALGNVDGVVVGIGTGTFLGRQFGSSEKYVGGWGLTLGDQASGAWLGRELLSRTLLAVDEMAPHSELTREILAEYHDTSEIVRFSMDFQPAETARFAPRIIAAAKRGDAIAAELMQEGASYVKHALTVLGWQETEPLCMTGGVGVHYVPYLPDACRKMITEPKGNALDGALALAAQLEETTA